MVPADFDIWFVSAGWILEETGADPQSGRPDVISRNGIAAHNPLKINNSIPKFIASGKNNDSCNI
jgi:hypothetical protein